MFHTLSPADWGYKEAQKTHTGTWNSYIKDAKGVTPRAQLAKCAVKLSSWITESEQLGQNSTCRNLDLKITDKAMIKFFKEVDKRNCEAAVEICNYMFNKDYPVDMLYEMYRKTVKMGWDPMGFEHLLCTKVVVGSHPRANTNVYVVTEDPETGDDVYEKGTIDDIFTKHSRVVPIVDFTKLWFTTRRFGMSIVCNHIIVWRGPLNHVSDACLQQLLSYLHTIRQFAWVNRKWRRVLKALLKHRLVDLDPKRWPTINDFDDISVAELEAMYDGHHPLRIKIEF